MAWEYTVTKKVGIQNKYVARNVGESEPQHFAGEGAQGGSDSELVVQRRQKFKKMSKLCHSFFFFLFHAYKNQKQNYTVL
jgi:hypothetical protein